LLLVRLDLDGDAKRCVVGLLRRFELFRSSPRVGLVLLRVLTSEKALRVVLLHSCSPIAISRDCDAFA